MKYYTSPLKAMLSIILLILCVSANILAQDAENPVTTTSTDVEIKVEKRYQIQLAAYQNPQLIKLDNFKNIGHGIIIENNNNGIHRVLIKNLKDEATAKTALAIIQAKGYKDAFFTTYETKIKPPTATTTTPLPTTTTPEIPTVETPIEPVFMGELDKPKDEVYLVELGAFESVNLLHNTAAIRSMGELFRQKVQGGEIIYIGIFEDLALAELTLKKALAQGYNSAGLKKVERSKILNTNGQNGFVQNVADRRDLKDRRTTPTTTSTTPAKPAIVVANTNLVNQSFEKMNFQIFKVDAYDPTNTTSFINTMLKGKEMTPSVLAFFDKNTDKSLNYYSIGSFDIAPNYTAYMIRTGKGLFHNDNNIYLYVYDQFNKKMVGKELISSVLTTTNTYSKIQTWITDANKDGILDLLIYQKYETTTADGQYASKNELTSKVWSGTAYSIADIKDADKLKAKLGVN